MYKTKITTLKLNYFVYWKEIGMQYFQFIV